MKRKSLALGMSAVMLIGILTGCGGGQADSNEGGESDSEQKTIKVLGLKEDSHMTPLQRGAEQFEKETGVKVEFETYPFDQFFEVIEVKLGSNSKGIDIIEVDVPMIAAYTYRDYIAPLDEYFTEEEKAKYVDSALESSTVDGKLMAPPIDNSSQLLYYNKDLLDMAGIPYPSEDPKDRLTWEEIEEMSVKVMDAAKENGQDGIWGLTFEQISRPYQMLALPQSLGGKAIGDDGFTVEGIMNSEPWIKAGQFYYDIHNTLNISPKGTQQSENNQMFSSGKTAFHVGGKWYINQIGNDSLNWGYAPHPYFEEGEPVTATGCWHIGVTKNSENKDIAAEFVKSMSLGYGNDQWMEYQGSVPARIDLVEKIAEDPKYEEFPYSAQKLAAYEVQNTAIPRPVTVGYREYDSTFNTCFEDIRNGMKPEDALNNAVSQLTASLAKYRE